MRGNYVGISVDGLIPFGNNTNISITSTSASTIGGNTTAHRNFIAGGTIGILIAGTVAQTVQGNYIGTDASGTLDYGADYGILIQSGSNNVIGGIGGGPGFPVSGQGNLISGNNIAGISITAGSASIRGNFIGTDQSGTAPLQNDTGIDINSATASTIGGTAATDTNIISKNQFGILLENGTQIVRGNYIGLDTNGNAFGNQFYGIAVTGGTNHAIGGAVNQRNYISSNGTNGVEVTGGTALIRSNYIGTDPLGTSARPNGTGVLISSTLASTIGGTTAALRNVISGNTGDGIKLTDGTQIVIGNYVGLDANGLLTLPNTGHGIEITGGTGHNIGGTSTNQRNFISGNTLNGIEISSGSAIIRANFIGLNTAGAIEGNNIGVNISSSDASIIGGNTTAMRNFISGNQYGIVLSAGTQTIQGNFIGTDTAGTGAMPNIFDGIKILGGLDHLIGGLATTERNIISGNGQNGINIVAGNAIIKANRIGLNTGGTGPVANGNDGILISSSSNSTIGGITTAERNFISDNLANGIEILNGTQLIIGNFIGLNDAGNGDQGNINDGILITGGTNHVIGGLTAGERNIISGNNNVGIEVTFDAVQILGNYIGTSSTGESPIGNGIGVLITSTTTNTIGGTASGSRNVISGNTVGIQLSGGGVHNIWGNYIGTDDDGVQDVGNSVMGIEIIDGNGHSIGGSDDTFRNIISGNNGFGISIEGTSSALVYGNYIGTNHLGTGAIVNGTGISITSTATSNIGSGFDPERNVISGNTNGVLISNGSQFVSDNYIGTDAGGTLDLGNTNYGIQMDGGSDHDIEDNVISGNNGTGIDIINTANATIFGNRIGTNAAGTGARNNGLGISINSTATSTVTGNLISANTNGVLLLTGNQIIEDNRIGTDINGTADLGNVGYGVRVAGGDQEIDFNTISGNNGTGVDVIGGTAAITDNFIGTSADGTAHIANLLGISISSSSNSLIGGNLISANSNGVLISNGQQTITGNMIGTDVTGYLDLGNAGYGVRVSGGSDHFIVSNLISGNNGTGVDITGGNALIGGNFIGTNTDGDGPLGNGTGISISSALSSTVQSNLISANSNGMLISNGTQYVYNNDIGLAVDGSSDLGNTHYGLRITGGSDHQILTNDISGNNTNGIEIAGSSGTIIQDNYIGTDSLGESAVGNGQNGILMTSGTGIIIGGSGTFERNIISANGAVGIRINGGTASIINNYIGTNVDGDAALGNAIGIRIGSGSSITIGGTGTNEGNLISGNGIGIFIATSNHLVLGNLIGVGADGVQNIGNTLEGISLSNADNNQIGGVNPGEANIIANSGAVGVLVNDSRFNPILHNSIYNNVVGISLINGGNNDQLAPLIATATYDPATNILTITGTMDGTAGTTYTIEFFANPAGTDIEGKTYIATLSLLATGPGTPFSINLGSPPAGTAFVTATATDSSNNDTSPFSNAKAINTPPVEVVNTGIVVITGETSSISAGNLTYTDGEQDPANIVYTVTTPPSTGQLELTTNPNVAITSFTQGDINAGLLFYRQNGFPATHDQFSFNVTDGQGGSVNNQVFNIAIEPKLLAEPIDLTLVFNPRRNDLFIPETNSFYMGNGFFNVQGVNQLSSFGNFIGFNQLVLTGNHSLSFGLIDGEPQLSHRSRDMGYEAAISALDYVQEYAGFKTTNPIVQRYIEDLIQIDEDAPTLISEAIAKPPREAKSPT